MDLLFLSNNEYKINEASDILSKAGIGVTPFKAKIEELQTQDTIKLVKDKTLKAFRMVGRPLFVEHTGLYLSGLNGFPGGLTQIFWDTLQADVFADLFGRQRDAKAQAKTVIGYCDGKKVYFFEGTVIGTISNEVRGSRDFQWDCIFVPDGYDQTFAELGSVKNDISMRRKALDQFAEFLRKRG